MQRIADIFKRLSIALEQAKVEYVVVGAVAGFNFNRIRTTMDIDIIINPSGLDLSEFCNKLKASGFSPDINDMKKAIEEKTHCTIFDDRSPMWLDILFNTSKLEYYSLHNSILIENKDFKIKAASIESYLISKLYFMRDIIGKEINEILNYKDVQDFISIYMNNKETIKEKEFLDRIKDFNLSTTWDIIKKILQSLN
jgi:hypothetical protein